MRSLRWIGPLVLAGVVVACGSNSHTGSGSAPTTAAPTTAAPTTAAPTTAAPSTVPPTTAPSATVGTKLTLENKSTVQLLAYGPGTPSILYTAQPGMSLVAADVEGCAVSESESFNPLYFSLKTSDNRKYNVDLGSIDGQIDSGEVVPGDCVKGMVGFVIPSSATASALYFDPITFRQSPLRWALPATTTSPPTTTPTTSSALTVVQQYFAAISSRDYQRAWDLGGKNLHRGSFTTYVQGLSTTVMDTITTASSEGNTVHVSFVATQTSGEQRTFQGTYTVANGAIVSANVTRTA